MKSNTKQLVINLDEIKNPHPEIHKVYKESGADKEFYPYQDKAEFINERRIFKIAAASNKHVKPRQVKHKIKSIYRRKEGRDKEYCFFYEHLMTTDLFGNSLDTTRQVGRYSYPHIVTQQGLNPNIDYGTGEATEPETTSIQIQNVEIRYEYEFSDLKPQLEKWYEEGIIDDNTNLTAWVGTRKYSVSSWDQFISFSIDDLVLLNMYHDKLPALGLATSELLQYVKQAAKDDIVKGLKGNSESKAKTKIR